MDAAVSVVGLEDIEEERFPESGLLHRKLTEALGCVSMRINAVTLGPGEATAAHVHDRQEEVYFTPTGGTVEVDGRAYDVPPNGFVRVDPSATRRVVNGPDGEAQLWIMFGAPPVGTVEDFGEYRLPE